MTGPRVAIAGMILETNSFAPVVSGDVFHGYLYLQGEQIVAEARAENSRAPRELVAFVAAMDCTGDWTPVPLVVSASPPAGAVDHQYFDATLTEIEKQLDAAEPVDGVYVVNHGAMVTTEQYDGDGEFVARVRAAAGENAKIVMTLDLHGNISQQMVSACDCIIGYQTNPHVDQVQCGEEAALCLRQMLANQFTSHSVLVRLPMTPASVTLLTRAGPYADVIDFGRRRQRELGGEIINVSVFGGFVFSDTRKNGIAIVVTAKDDIKPAHLLAVEIASFAWSIRQQFQKSLTTIDTAMQLAAEHIADPSLPAIIFSDAGDNPGGGGSGNTTDLLRAFIDSDATGVLYGSFFEPQLAAQAYSAGVGATLQLTLNASAQAGTGESLFVTADVVAVSEEDIVGRRGIFRNRRLKLGPMVALAVGASRGITIVLISQRVQTADPVQFEALALDPGKARIVTVKSRGHFRAGFEQWFANEQIYEVDTPGYTSPVLSRFKWRGLPRPVFPLDDDVKWSPPSI